QHGHVTPHLHARIVDRVVVDDESGDWFRPKRRGDRIGHQTWVIAAVLDRGPQAIGHDSRFPHPPILHCPAGYFTHRTGSTYRAVRCTPTLWLFMPRPGGYPPTGRTTSGSAASGPPGGATSPGRTAPSGAGSVLAIALAVGEGLGLRGFLGPDPPPRPR